MKKVTILFVDDSDTIRKFISFGLKIRGYKVILATDGQDALEKLAVNDVDVIITDLNMPNMDGFEFIKNLKSDDFFSKLPIIVLTTEGNKEEIEKAKKLGADKYLIKPFKIDVIIKEIEESLSVNE